MRKRKITSWGFKVGTKIEMEHTKNKKLARKIAFDHLNEYGDDYYKARDNKINGYYFKSTS